jgi:hypothetical protein
MSRPLAGLSALIAATATFQAKVNALTAEAALAAIHYPKVRFTGDDPPARPLAIVTDDDIAQWERSRNGASAGSLLVTFEFPAHPDYDPDSADALLDFTNTVGAIIDEALTLANTPMPSGEQYWNAIKFTRIISPSLCDERRTAAPNEPGSLYFEVSFLVDWV